MNQRQRKIIDLLDGRNEASVSELAGLLRVSAVTVRQDLSYLQDEGFLQRIHGGAVLRSADDISKRLVLNYDKKLAIALRAADFIDRDETILIESGSTNAILVKELGRRPNVNVITTNAFIAQQLKKSAQANIILLGGIYQHESDSLVGQLTKLCLEHVHFSKAFVGVDGYTIESGFTSADMQRAEISGLIARKSNEVFVLTDSSKFGRVHLATLFRPDDITHLVTDSGIPEREQRYLQNQQVEVVVV